MRVLSILGAVLCSHLAHGYYAGSSAGKAIKTKQYGGSSTKGATSPYRLYSNSKAGTKGTGSKARDEYFDEAYFDYYFDEPSASAGKTKKFAARENYFDDAYYYDDEYDEEYDAEYYDEAYDMYEE